MPSWLWLSMNCRINFWPKIHRVDDAVLKLLSDRIMSSLGSNRHLSTRLVLQAKVLSIQKLQRDDINRRHITWDLSHEYLAEDAIYYLLLGVSNRKHPLCQVLTSFDSGLFRRVGFGNYCYTDMWHLCTPTEITLV